MELQPVVRVHPWSCYCVLKCRHVHRYSARRLCGAAELPVSCMDPQQPQSFLGAPIKIVTTTGDALEGELFCYDTSNSKSIVLRQTLPNGRISFKWVRQAMIQEVTALGPPPDVLEDLPAVDLGKVEARTTAAIADAWRQVGASSASAAT
eukprot:3830990-Amphidinium_carterae.1